MTSRALAAAVAAAIAVPALIHAQTKSADKAFVNAGKVDIHLDGGDYEVRAEQEGFRTLMRDAQVLAGSETSVNFSMSIGATREVVTVEAATAQINYDSHSVAGSIERKAIQELPLNGSPEIRTGATTPDVANKTWPTPWMPGTRTTPAQRRPLDRPFPS